MGDIFEEYATRLYYNNPSFNESSLEKLFLLLDKKIIWVNNSHGIPFPYTRDNKDKVSFGHIEKILTKWGLINERGLLSTLYYMSRQNKYDSRVKIITDSL